MNYKNYLLALLVLGGVVSIQERFVFSLALEPIKHELGLTDTQLGLMSGIAFSAFYALAGIPIARWADTGNRVTITSLSCAVLGLMVSLCGIASNFVQLLLVRTGVAVGEAGIVPAAQSLISDYFDRAERPRALAIFISFYSISMIVGYLLGGQLVDALGWRQTFIVMGAPAVLIAIVIRLTLREPRRERAAINTVRPPGLLRTAGLLWRQATYRQILLAFCVGYFFNVGTAQWLPTFYIRSFEMDGAEVGMWLSVAFGGFGTLGIVAGGYFGSLFAARKEKLQMRVLALLSVGAGVASLAMYLSPSKELSLGFLSVYAVIAMFNNGPVFAAIQSLSQERMRSVTVAVTFLFANLIGFGLGPLALGFMSDGLSSRFGPESLRYALALFAPGTVWIAFHFWKAGTTIESDIQGAEKDSQLAESAAHRLPVEHS